VNNIKRILEGSSFKEVLNSLEILEAGGRRTDYKSIWIFTPEGKLSDGDPNTVPRNEYGAVDAPGCLKIFYTHDNYIHIMTPSSWTYKTAKAIRTLNKFGTLFRNKSIPITKIILHISSGGHYYNKFGFDSFDELSTFTSEQIQSWHGDRELGKDLTGEWMTKEW